DAQVYSKVKVSRGQAGKYFREHKDEFRRPARARARQIVVQTRAEADKITAELRRGADFAALARARSLSPDSKSGGDLGYFSKGEMPPQFAVVFRMRPGGISRVVKSPYGYHIFKLEELRKAAEPDFAEAYPEAVKRLAQEAGEDEFARWHAALKARTRLEVNFDMLRKL
ncbi:MAG TPA: peptidylprolyl isomerase, partial [Nitrospirota bacterium]|nr:peptidylprolyl isomerase [Nitrospirota bacterium]